jgi:GNAT superfamily N-acetyltransferase
MAPIRYYFGRSAPNEGQAERFTRVLPPERIYAAWEGSRAVGGLGAFPFELTVPGGRVPAAGVTVAAVLPTHRRRGILRAMMRALLDACHQRGEPVAYLWATEDTIYGRFGFGLASFTAEIDLPRERSAFHASFATWGRVQFVPPARPKNCLRRFTNGWPPRHQGCSREAQRGGRHVHLTIRSGGAGPMGICNAPSSNMEGGLQLTHFIE